MRAAPLPFHRIRHACRSEHVGGKYSAGPAGRARPDVTRVVRLGAPVMVSAAIFSTPRGRQVGIRPGLGLGSRRSDVWRQQLANAPAVADCTNRTQIVPAVVLGARPTHKRHGQRDVAAVALQLVASRRPIRRPPIGTPAPAIGGRSRKAGCSPAPMCWRWRQSSATGCCATDSAPFRPPTVPPD